MAVVPICLRCKFCPGDGQWRCIVHATPGTDIVTGETGLTGVVAARDERTSGLCGPTGTLFQPK